MNIENEHEQKETITVDRFYYNHPPRKESSLFRHTKHQLIVVEDTPCWICGSKMSREVHHMTVEWADAEAVDWSEDSNIRKDFPNFPWAAFQEPEDFVDSRWNMRVLCKKHHIGKDHGIHALPYPIFQIQRYKKADFVFSPDEATANG